MGLLSEVLAVELQRRPFLLRNVLDLLRRRAPVLQFGNTCLVLGAARVREVFERPADFVNGPIYSPKLKVGPLILGMDVSTRYATERRTLEHALSAGGLVERFRELVRQQAEVNCQARRVPGRVDLVGEIIEPTFARALCDLFGLDPALAKSRYVCPGGQGLPVFIQWLRKLGGIIAAGVPAPFGLDALTEALAPEMHDYFVRRIEAGAPADSVIARMRDSGAFPSADDVAHSAAGMMLAGATLFKATALAFRGLAARPAILDRATRAAQEEDLKLLGALVWEALRFEPPFPLLVRYCPRGTVLGGVAVNAGSTVYVSTLSAMFDPDFVEAPAEFSILRRPEEYLIFGHGRHECVARHLADIGIPQLIAVVLRAFRIKSVGTLGQDGPAVARYPVSIDLPTTALVSNHATVSCDYPGHRETGTYLKHPSSGRIRLEPDVEKEGGSGTAS